MAVNQKDQLTKSKSEQTSGTSRRAALKKMVIGTGIAAGAAGLPSKWAKPVVDRVLVPAHAQTSTTTTTTAEPLPTNFRGEASIQVNLPPNPKFAKTGLIETLAGKILPVAHAYQPPIPTEVDLCIKLISDTMFEAKLLFKLPMRSRKNAAFAAPSGENGIPYGYYYFEGSGTADGTKADFVLTVEPCHSYPIPLVQIAVAMISATGATYTITGGVTGSAPPSLPVEGGCPVKPEPEECDD